jgi:hypothetical protein
MDQRNLDAQGGNGHWGWAGIVPSGTALIICCCFSADEYPTGSPPIGTMIDRLYAENKCLDVASASGITSKWRHVRKWHGFELCQLFSVNPTKDPIL